MAEFEKGKDSRPFTVICKCLRGDFTKTPFLAGRDLKAPHPRGGQAVNFKVVDQV